MDSILALDSAKSSFVIITGGEKGDAGLCDAKILKILILVLERVEKSVI